MTDLTMGRFVKILDKPSKGWYKPEKDEEEVEKEDDDDDDDDDEMEEDEWLGVVEWMDAPFADSGDSWSLVFARDDGLHARVQCQLR